MHAKKPIIAGRSLVSLDGIFLVVFFAMNFVKTQILLICNFMKLLKLQILCQLHVMRFCSVDTSDMELDGMMDYNLQSDQHEAYTHLK